MPGDNVLQLPGTSRPSYERHHAPRLLRLCLRMLAADLATGTPPGPRDLAEAAQRLHQARNLRQAHREERRFARELLAYLTHDDFRDETVRLRQLRSSGQPGGV